MTEKDRNHLVYLLERAERFYHTKRSYVAAINEAALADEKPLIPIAIKLVREARSGSRWRTTSAHWSAARLAASRMLVGDGGP